MANVYTGQVQGLAKYTAGAPNTIAAFCREVLSGTLSFDAHNIRKVGAGGQLHVRKGTTEATLDVTAVGVALVDLALFFPTTAGVQVTFPDTNTGFLVEVDDGSNGQEWLLSSCQPASIEMSCGDAPDAEVEVHVTIKGILAQQAQGTDAAVYNSVKGHTINECTVQLAAADIGALSWSLSNDLGVEMFNPQDTKSADSLTDPEGYIVTTQAPTISIVTSEVQKLGAAAILGDTWTGEAITVALDNGVGAEDITITCTTFVPQTVNMPLEAEGRVGFGHEFAPGDGTLYNRVTFA